MVSKSLACIKSRGFCPNYYHSFSIPSLCRIIPKIKGKYISVVFSCPFFLLVSPSWVVTLVVYVSKIKTVNIHRMLTGSPILAIKRASANHEQNLSRFGFVIFHGKYIVVLVDPGVDYYLCSCHICDLVLLQERGYLSRLQKIWYTQILNLLCLKFVKVQQSPIFLNLLGLNFHFLLT